MTSRAPGTGTAPTGLAEAHGHRVSPNELGFKLRLSVFYQHLDDFLQILVGLIKSLRLTVSTWKAWDVPDVKPCIWARFYNCRELLHTCGPVTPYSTAP